MDGRKQQQELGGGEVIMDVLRHEHLTIGTFLMNLLATDTNAMDPSTSTNLPWFLSGCTNWDNPHQQIGCHLIQAEPAEGRI